MDNTFDKKYQDDDLVMLTCIRSISLAEEIERVLQENDIECFLRNIYSSVIMGGIDVGGIRVDIRYKDVERALDILSKEGIVLPDENESAIGQMSSFADRLPFFKNVPLEKRLWIVILFVFVAFGLLLLLYTFIVTKVSIK